MVVHDDEDEVKIGIARVISKEVKWTHKTTKGRGSETRRKEL